MRILPAIRRAAGQMQGGMVSRPAVSALLGTAAFLLACAVAQAAPQLVPTRDVTVNYIVIPRDHAPIEVRVSVQAGGLHLRVAGESLPISLLVDRREGTAAILLPMLKLYDTVAIGRFDPERTILRGAHFERRGDRHLAGLACTDWTAVSPRGHASACITPDGVILAGMASDASGDLGTVRATVVAYGALPPVLFRLPDGYHDAGGAIGLAGAMGRSE